MYLVYTHQAYLLLLFILPIIVMLHFVALRSKKYLSYKFSNFDAIARIKGIELYSKNIVILILVILTLTLLIFSLSGATLVREGSASSFSFVIAIDSSSSMGAVDFTPTRIDAAKQTALDFVSSVPEGTHIGIVSFSGSSVIEQDITTDKYLLRQAINGIKISSIGGTDLYDALVTSSNMLEGQEQKAVILLSDGQFNVGNLDQSINYATQRNVMVHTIAIGTVEGGSTQYGFSKVEVDSLKALAYNTNGAFSQASNVSGLQSAFGKIQDLKVGNIRVDLNFYLLTGSIVLIVLLFVLINTRYRMFP